MLLILYFSITDSFVSYVYPPTPFPPIGGEEVADGEAEAVGTAAATAAPPRGATTCLP